MPDIPPTDDLLRNTMLAEYEEVFGECSTTWGLKSDRIPLEIHLYEDDPPAGVKTLVTTGMAAKPMNVPANCQDPELWQHAELGLVLPRDWPLDEKSMDDERWFWPFRALANAATYPHGNNSWIWWHHTVGEEAFHKSTKLSTALFLPAPDEIELSPVTLEDGRQVHLMFLAFLYPEETCLKFAHGWKALEEKFSAAGMGRRELMVLDPDRPNVAKRKLFGR